MVDSSNKPVRKKDSRIKKKAAERLIKKMAPASHNNVASQISAKFWIKPWLSAMPVANTTDGQKSGGLEIRNKKSRKDM